MNAEPDRPGRLEGNLAAAQDRIRQLEGKLCEAEQELKAASNIINEQEVEVECLRIQLEAADLMLDEAAAARRRLEKRIADLEDAKSDELDNPCPVIVPVPQEPAPPQHPGYPPGYKPNPLVEAMIAQYRRREKK